MNKTRVLLIFGGVSTEHEVSRCSASSIIKEIDDNQFELHIMEISKKNECYLYDLKEDKHIVIEEIKKVDNQLQKKAIEFSVDFIRRYDVVFPIIHGTEGEDGKLQGLFEVAGVPYVGANVLSSAIGMDKTFCKILFERAGIPQADYLAFTIDDDASEIVEKVESKFTYPLFIKPASQGSSVGVTKAYDRTQLEAGIELCRKVDRKILVEEFIKGRELECAVLGNYVDVEASNIGEVLLKSDFYSYEAKYVAEEKTVITSDLDEKVVLLIKEYAIKAFKAIDCYGLARVDFFLQAGNKPVLNEINTLPGFTKISMYPKLMVDYGIPYKDLISRLINLALERSRKYHFIVDFEEVR
ncbi:MAG: D-alanine--D-alanine ligase [Clostridia bacterium]|nr:D-alanine--D-alanine ligase [Clostridia bacterium]